jgi:hypothetical protein
MTDFRYRKTMKSRPRRLRSGDIFFMLPRSAVQNRSEESLIISFVSDRHLFGHAYAEVQPSFFSAMPQDSGVFICPLVRTRDIVAQATRPGDIDLLVIPYEGDQLILDHVLAVEAKAVRARFTRQGTSPNEFGFSQAVGLLALGLPYVAVAHLIVSDVSPQDHWQEMMKARVGLHDELELIGPETLDPMPKNLTDRVYGRLLRASTLPAIGLISAYVWSISFGNENPKEQMIIIPNGRAAYLNPQTSIATLDAVAAFYEENYKLFLDNPRHDPPSA